MLNFLISLIRPQTKLSYQSKNLKAGAEFISNDCKYGLQHGVSPIIYKVNFLDRNRNLINVSAIFNGKVTLRENMTLEKLINILF